MLRFIRKYQLVILAIGGSLLMVVFLFQPVLTRLSPSPLKTKVAKLDDGSTYTRMDLQQANVAINLLKRVNPRALGPRSAGGIGLDTSSDTNTALHWLMLVKQAQDAGLVGEAGDGAAWLNDIAQTEAFIQVRTEAQQGAIQQDQIQQRLTDLQAQILSILNRNANLTAQNAGGSIDAVYKILAEARGVYRLLSSITTLPASSDLNAILAVHDAADSMAINAAVLDSSLAANAVAEPTDEQLQAFFDEYRAQSPADNEYRIGYTQPTRLELGWMTLEKNTFMNAVKVDRVELNKIWRKNRDAYPGDFASERFELERKYREDQAMDMMAEADRIIRAQVLAATKAFSKTEGNVNLPEDWTGENVRLENIAQKWVTKINDQFSVDLPMPTINMIGDRWLNANAIASLDGFGKSIYRVGSRQIPAYGLPQFFELEGANTTGLDVQVNLPLVDPPSTDEIGNQYYAEIIGVRDAGPADTIADVTRETVLNDYRSVEGYKLLVARSDEFKGAIVENDDLAPAIDLAMAMSPDPSAVTQPSVFRNILVRKDAIDRGRLASFVDPRLNVPAFREAVLEAGTDLDPLTPPETLAQNPVAIVTPIPEARSVAAGLMIAPRPVSEKQFRVIAQGVINDDSGKELLAAAEGVTDPFTFASLSKRFGLEKLNDDDERSDSENAESNTEDQDDGEG
ncbi:MAG: hypothetical protein ACWA5W_06495 [Phycisphaerales bacterium]